jgi:hypothetical protein
MPSGQGECLDDPSEVRQVQMRAYELLDRGATADARATLAALLPSNFYAAEKAADCILVLQDPAATYREVAEAMRVLIRLVPAGATLV